MPEDMRSFTPLCPAGHLPHKGGDQPSKTPASIINAEIVLSASVNSISPLVGEMSGRTEGGEFIWHWVSPMAELP